MSKDATSFPWPAATHECSNLKSPLNCLNHALFLQPKDTCPPCKGVGVKVPLCADQRLAVHQSILISTFEGHFGCDRQPIGVLLLVWLSRAPAIPSISLLSIAVSWGHCWSRHSFRVTFLCMHVTKAYQICGEINSAEEERCSNI